MKVRLLHAWKIWPVGHVIPEMRENVARLLIHKGIGEEVKDEKRLAFTAPVDRAVRSTQMTLKSKR